MGSSYNVTFVSFDRHSYMTSFVTYGRYVIIAEYKMNAVIICYVATADNSDLPIGLMI